MVTFKDIFRQKDIQSDTQPFLCGLVIPIKLNYTDIEVAAKLNHFSCDIDPSTVFKC